MNVGVTLLFLFCAYKPLALKPMGYGQKTAKYDSRILREKNASIR